MQPAVPALDEEPCPISTDTLGAMYRSSPEGLTELISSIPPAVRGMLAVYCYRRSHLASIGLAVAATCTEDDLTRTGGNAGAMLYQASRATARAAGPALSRRKITLATGMLRTMTPLDEDFDDEIEAENAAA